MHKKFSHTQKTKRLVLVVDDEFINREILCNILQEDYHVLYAENGRQALQMVKEHGQTLSLILLDLLMPEMDGFEVIEILRADAELKHIPIIVATSENTAEVKSLKMGAVDFIKKPYDAPEVILARVSRIIELSEDKMIIQAAEKDELTDLFSKTFFYEYTQMMERYYPEWEMDAIVLNIDHFHLVNEIYGRPFGDRVLKLIADMIRDYLIEVEGMACRCEADTFFVYATHQETYTEFLYRILDGLEELSKTPRIRLRMGVYTTPGREIEMERRFDRAKIACNTLRGNYAKSIAYYDMNLHDKSIFSERLINDIHDALEQKQFKVYFQPKYDLQSDTPVLRSAEALIRWQHPEFGMVSPGAFIPLFEQNGLIQMLDYYVWRETAAQIRKWKDECNVTIPVSVNVSRIDLYDPLLEDKLLGLLKEYNLTTKEMYLEITESAYADDADQLIDAVEALRQHGFMVEMDDFGSGYSSLNMLALMPVDVLKLDMKFVRRAHEDEMSLRMIQLIVDIAHFLAVPVVAEGIELEEQYHLLKESGCTVGQGYYFSKPVSAEEFSQFFEK
ncbi:MAG: EAL domain-containing protein [Lachnospiraceae bacterium]|nr:EAL domain-containing protein [Lachnospiraceae bacterium]